jgi:excisionase family DNA binding protein
MSEPEYLTVAEVAARLGVTERTVQKRCAAGKLAASLVSTPEGERWHIERANFDANDANSSRTDGANGREEFAQMNSERPEQAANFDTNARTDGREPDANARELLNQSREEIAFLRSMLEARERDAAELRAALREALKAMPKALGEAGSTPEEAQKSPNKPVSGDGFEAGNKTPTESASAPQKGRKREVSAFQRVMMRLIGIGARNYDEAGKGGV